MKQTQVETGINLPEGMTVLLHFRHGDIDNITLLLELSANNGTFDWASDLEKADNKHEGEPVNVEVKQADQTNASQAKEGEYIEFKMYENNYYTQDSDSEGLFAFTEILAAKV
ncbi:hypothetical protein H2248_002848 [Termitomyces sp. 'cryptogamus']|nr:hypothetical protein H2248_002848 [Termitomyces sp. 'cryptogamus']